MAISGRVMPECGQDKGLQVLSTEAQRTREGTGLIMANASLGEWDPNRGGSDSKD